MNVFLFEGCIEGDKKQQIEKYLGVSLPDSSRDFFVYKVNFSSDYSRPYNVYIKFKADTLSCKKLIAALDLVDQNSDFKSILCIQGLDTEYLKNLWSFNSRTHLLKNEDTSKKIQWWNMTTEMSFSLYAAFYRDKKGFKIEHCYSNEWDGRILLGYNKWENFEKVIGKAREACKNAGEKPDDHFPDVRKTIGISGILH